MRRVKAEFGIIGPVFRSDIILGGTALDLTERYSMDSASSRAQAQDAIAARQLSTLGHHQNPRDGRLRLNDVRQLAKQVRVGPDRGSTTGTP